MHEGAGRRQTTCCCRVFWIQHSVQLTRMCLFTTRARRPEYHWRTVTTSPTTLCHHTCAAALPRGCACTRMGDGSSVHALYEGTYVGSRTHAPLHADLWTVKTDCRFWAFDSTFHVRQRLTSRTSDIIGSKKTSQDQDFNNDQHWHIG